MEGYWLTEFVKVLCGYAFLMFLWPTVVFGAFLKGRSRTFRFGFCVTAQPVLTSVFVLLAGFVGVLSKTMFAAVVYGIFIFCASVQLVLFAKRRGFFDEQRQYGRGGIDRYALRRTGENLKKRVQTVWNKYKGFRLEYLMLIAMLVYGVVYFSYGAFQDHSYGCRDMYVHASNISGLIEGTLFSNGIYPLGMHGFIYGIYSISGIDVYSIMLFLAGIHIITFLVSAYVLLKELLQSRYACLLALLLFLTMEAAGDINVYAMSRLQYTIPMEFGLYTVFLCPAFLIRYLKTSKRTKAKYLWNGELLIFLLSAAASVSIHYYAAIMAFLLCICAALFSWKQVITPERLVPLSTVILAGVVLAGAFVLAGYAKGATMNGSINWALAVMQGQASEFDSGMKILDTYARLAAQWRDGSLIRKITLLWECGYGDLYGGVLSVLVAFVSVLSFAGCIAVQRLRKEYPVYVFYRKAAAGYGLLALFSFLYVFLYAASSLRIFALVSGPRLCSVLQLLSMAVLIIPMDMLFAYFDRLRKAQTGYMSAAFVSACVWIVALEFLTGTYHGYLYYQLTQYDAAVNVTESIIRSVPARSYTVVAPSDVVGQVRQYGWHEELLHFVDSVYHEENYTLPTEYIYLYVEKNAIRYAQSHFFTGPEWLAQDKYAKSYTLFDMPVSRCPEVEKTALPGRVDADGLDYTVFATYMDAEDRAMLESLAYKWSQEFMSLYPNVMTIYYEDEDFVCYKIHQDEQAKLKLVIGD